MVRIVKRELGGIFFFQAEDGIRNCLLSRGLGGVYKGQRLLSAWIPAPPQPAWRRSRLFTAITLALCALGSASYQASSQAGAPADGQRASSTVDGREALQNAAHLVRQGQLDDAERQARRALADPATQAAAYSVLGTISFQRQRVDDSIGFLKKAIQLDDRLVGAHLSLAEIYIRQGKTRAARPLFERVLTLDPSNVSARLALARMETEKKNYQRSVDLAAPVMSAFTQSPEGLYILATDFFGLGDRPAATALTRHWTRLENVPPEAAIAFSILFATHGAGPKPSSSWARSAQRQSVLKWRSISPAHLAAKRARALENYDAAPR